LIVRSGADDSHCIVQGVTGTGYFLSQSCAAILR
jgi:hypothetical protein